MVVFVGTGRWPHGGHVVGLSGELGLITGAGRGIVWAMALELSRTGADLILIARTESELAETTAQVRSLGREVLSIVADVSHREEVQLAVSQGLEKFGEIDFLINNAGVQPPIGPLVKNPPDEWIQTVAVN